MKRRMTIIGLIMAFAVSINGTPIAETHTAQESVLARLAGTWSGSGQHLGMKATMQMKWERVLEGKFVRLSLRVDAIKKDGGKQVFEGNAYYRQTEPTRFEANWFDSHGDVLQVKARQEGETLTALWGDPAKIEGRSTYRLTSAGKNLEVVDEFRAKDGAWKDVGRFLLSRARD